MLEYGQTQPSVPAGPHLTPGPTWWRSVPPAVGPSLPLCPGFRGEVEEGLESKPALPSPGSTGTCSTCLPCSSTDAVVGQAQGPSGLGQGASTWVWWRKSALGLFSPVSVWNPKISRDGPAYMHSVPVSGTDRSRHRRRRGEIKFLPP